MQKIYRSREVPGRHKKIEGTEHLDKVINIDQSPIGRTPRSNPATYTGVFDKIRTLFASTQEAKIRGYQPGRFSFNVKGGRCEACQGDGTIKIEMHFLPDVYVPCEVCKGARYNRDTLDITWKDKNIAEVLDMPAEEALAFFENQPSIARQLQTLVDVGLGYVRLGQPAPTLSGGEAQRVKLSTELGKRADGPDDLHPRRADDRAALRRRAPAAGRAAASGRRRQHDARDRAQPRRRSSRPTGSSTSDPKAARAAAKSSPRERPSRSPRSRRATPASSSHRCSASHADRARRRSVGAERALVAGRFHRRRRRGIRGADPAARARVPRRCAARARRRHGRGPGGAASRSPTARGLSSVSIQRARSSTSLVVGPAASATHAPAHEHCRSPTPPSMRLSCASCSSTSPTTYRRSPRSHVCSQSGGRFVFFLNHPLLQAPNSGWMIDHMLEEEYWRVGPYLADRRHDGGARAGRGAAVRAPAAVAVRQRAGAPTACSSSGWRSRRRRKGFSPAPRSTAPPRPSLVSCSW